MKPGPRYQSHIERALRGVLSVALFGYAVLCIVAAVAFLL